METKKFNANVFLYNQIKQGNGIYIIIKNISGSDRIIPVLNKDWQKEIDNVIYSSSSQIQYQDILNWCKKMGRLKPNRINAIRLTTAERIKPTFAEYYFLYILEQLDMEMEKILILPPRIDPYQYQDNCVLHKLKEPIHLTSDIDIKINGIIG